MTLLPRSSSSINMMQRHACAHYNTSTSTVVTTVSSSSSRLFHKGTLLARCGGAPQPHTRIGLGRARTTSLPPAIPGRTRAPCHHAIATFHLRVPIPTTHNTHRRCRQLAQPPCAERRQFTRKPQQLPAPVARCRSANLCHPHGRGVITAAHRCSAATPGIATNNCCRPSTACCCRLPPSQLSKSASPQSQNGRAAGR